MVSTTYILNLLPRRLCLVEYRAQFPPFFEIFFIDEPQKRRRRFFNEIYNILSAGVAQQSLAESNLIL